MNTNMVDSKEKRRQVKMARSNTRTGSQSCHNLGSDTIKLSEASKKMYARLKPPTIQELVQFFNGDKYKLAFELTKAKLGSIPDTDIYKKTYQNNLHDINRYMRKERTPSSEMKELFKKIFIPESEKPLTVKIRGCVQFSQTYYYKATTWDNPIIIPANLVNNFLKLASENNEAGYMYLNGIYMKSGTHSDDFTWLSNVQIDMSF